MNRSASFRFLIVIFFCCVAIATFSLLHNRKEVYLTVVTNDEYITSVKVLGISLRENKATRDFVVVISEAVTQPKIDELNKLGFTVIQRNSIPNPKIVICYCCKD